MKSPLRRLIIVLAITLLAGFIALPPNLSHSTLDIHLGQFSLKRSFDLALGLDLAGGSHLVFEADTSMLAKEDKDAAIEAARDTIDRRVNLFGVSESAVSITKVGESRRIVVELPGVKDTQSAVSLIGQTARLDFRELKDTPEATIAATLKTTESTGFTGADFKRARPSFGGSTSKPVISFETKTESAKKFGDITTRLVGKPLVIFLDDVPISAPVVQEPITSGTGQITGNFTTEETRMLSNLLNSGSLPVPIKLIEQRTIEASLGAESVRLSVFAGLVGLGAVLLFMVAYYGRLGLLAGIGLLVYGSLTIALYKLIPVVLTLPGVAGFILSVGMAVDANILVFERMKEELRAGRDWPNSMELGFGRAWDSIRDANIATLLTVFILLNPLNLSFLHTSGPIRGFALTLGLGILISLFTGIFVTRTIMRIFAKQ